MSQHEEQLMKWAEGMPALEAGTWLLIQTNMAGPGRPWVKRNDAQSWIDFDAIPDLSGGMSGGERRLLRIAASLGGDEALTNLGNDLRGLSQYTDTVLDALKMATRN